MDEQRERVVYAEATAALEKALAGELAAGGERAESARSLVALSAEVSATCLGAVSDTPGATPD